MTTVRSSLFLACTFMTMLTSSLVSAHGVIPKQSFDEAPRQIQFPDTAEFKTLVLDPHTHSSFSDGHVWPSVRVAEALYDGLDAIAITEHLEWQPHRADLPHPDRNRAYEIALQANGDNELMIIPGTEITRALPAGHINALFISDANKLVKHPELEDQTDVRAYYQGASEWPAQEAVNAANEQGAFLFWNHAWWGSDFPNGIPKAPKFHKDNAKRNLIHGIEIANGDSYSEESFQIALDLDLTLIGVSDIHGLIDWDFVPHEGGHRPVTLVLAKERSQASMREALFDGRTAVWFKNLLIGRQDNLQALLAASMSVKSATYKTGSDILTVEIENVSDAAFQLQNMSGMTFGGSADIVDIEPHAVTTVAVRTGKRLDQLSMKFTVLNALTKPKKAAKFKLYIDKIEAL
jgi:hypothetical protein